MKKITQYFLRKEGKTNWLYIDADGKRTDGLAHRPLFKSHAEAESVRIAQKDAKKWSIIKRIF